VYFIVDEIEKSIICVNRCDEWMAASTTKALFKTTRKFLTSLPSVVLKATDLLQTTLNTKYSTFLI
jgi:hypothetical protein